MNEPAEVQLSTVEPDYSEEHLVISQRKASRDQLSLPLLDSLVMDQSSNEIDHQDSDASKNADDVETAPVQKKSSLTRKPALRGPSRSHWLTKTPSWLHRMEERNLKFHPPRRQVDSAPTDEVVWASVSRWIVL